MTSSNPLSPKGAEASTVSNKPPKLRDSCQSCAISKVRCNKEKPVCARCVKRSLKCEYFITKRAGRRHEPRPSTETATTKFTNNHDNHDNNDNHDDHDNNDNNDNHPSSAASSSEVDILMLDSSSLYASPDVLQQSSTFAPLDVSSTQAVIPNDPTTWWMPTPRSSDFNDLFALPSSSSISLSYPVSETLSTDILGQSQLPTQLSGGDDSDSLIPLQDLSFFLDMSNSEVFNRSTSSAFLTTQAATCTDNRATTTTDGDKTLDNSPYCCLTRSLELLKKQFPGSTACACETTARGGDENDARAIHYRTHNIESVIQENKRTLEAIDNMLQCPCSGGDYLLAIISLVVFKVLDWYTAVVHGAQEAQLGLDDSDNDSNIHNSKWGIKSQRVLCHSEQVVLQTPAVVCGYHIDGDHKGRMAAQLVLSELHRVQRLVNLMSDRLRSTEPVSTDCDVNDNNGRDTAPQFMSSTWFNKLESDIRERVCTLSFEIVDMLRQR
ncbi:hypothetical protein EIK77_007078 [Talaromyces pinophilus]|nr:hypothetical protein EIK77_007078 [Talaromyces pinophilus]